MAFSLVGSFFSSTRQSAAMVPSSTSLAGNVCVPRHLPCESYRAKDRSSLRWVACSNTPRFLTAGCSMRSGYFRRNCPTTLPILSSASRGIFPFGCLMIHSIVRGDSSQSRAKVRTSHRPVSKIRTSFVESL